MDKATVLDRLDIRAFYSAALPSLHVNGSDTGQALCIWHEDTNPSLSINLKTGAFKCFGCGKKGSIFDWYMEAHGVDYRTAFNALAQEAGITTEQAPSRKILETYDYSDEAGALLFQAVRYVPKDFKQRQPDGKGGWIWNLKGVRLVPYNLPAVLKAKSVIIVEGEKDVHTLRDLGLVASCNAQGAGKWRQEYNEYFRGKKVAILPDNDDPGRKHAQQVAQALTGTAAAVKIVDLPGLQEKGDVSDWIAAGGTRDALIDLIRHTTDPGTVQLSTPYIRQVGQMDNTPFDPLSVLKRGSDLQALDCHVEWVIDKLLPKESITLFHGRGGIGKTWLSLIMGNAVSQGRPFMGLATMALPVVFMDFENSLPVLVDRVKKIGAADVLFWHNANEAMRPPKLDRQEWETYKALPPGSLLIFDTLRASQGRDENNSQDMADIMGRLKDLRDKGFTIVLLHHTPKGNERTYKGSTAILDLADHVLSLHRVKRSNPDEIIDDDEDADCNYRFGTKDKTRYEPYHVYLTFNKDKGFEIAIDPDLEDVEAVYEVLQAAGRVNQSQAFGMVKERLDMKSKGLFLKLMRKGEGRFWTSGKEGRSVVYTICPSVPPLYMPDNRTDEAGTVQNSGTDALPHSPQTLDISHLSNCPDMSGTGGTNEEITVLEVVE